MTVRVRRIGGGKGGFEFGLVGWVLGGWFGLGERMD